MTDAPASGQPYRVLARKYRPGHFRDLIGQEAMVRTLTSAFETGRIAHAFILTGVRGVGKTTTARIIAKGLNCTRGDRPTIDPCGVCDACVSIAEGRNTDVLEMDAASNTGVGDVREIIESVRYRAAQSRYKVYIVDEVHMLSTNAFNALLKTLEEPPEHVKFVFATTEIRKLPVTVLSRCQRFDLRRIEPEAMMAHLAGVAAAEGAEIEPGALALITRAAEGSVRDALSLLDQALAMGAGRSGTDEVRAMLGLADRGRVIDLFEAVMRGDAKAALAELSAQYAEGADPGLVLRDLAELTHWISVLKVSPEMAADPTVPPEERARGQDLASRLPLPALARSWQMLLKAIEELGLAPSAMMAAEMALIRLTHVADLPPPGEIVRRLAGAGADGGAAPVAPSVAGGGAEGQGGGPGAAAPSGAGAIARSDAAAPRQAEAAAGPRAGLRLAAVAGGRVLSAPRAEADLDREAGHAPDEAPDRAAGDRAAAGHAPDPLPAGVALPRFEDALALLAERRELRLLDAAESFVELVSYRPGLIEFSPAPGAPADLAGRLAQTLTALTGTRWSVAVTEARGAPTLAARREAARAAALAEAGEHPLVRAALAAFPGAEIRALRPLDPGAGDTPPAGDYLAAVPEDDDDPDAEDGFDARIDTGGALFDTDDPFEEM